MPVMKILGTARLGNLSERKASEILDCLEKLHVDGIDTAPTYPKSEILIGKFFTQNPGCQLKIFTKWGRGEQLSLDSFKSSIYSSLKAMKVDSIYSVSVHNRKISEIPQEVFEQVIKFKSEGVINKFGWCGDWENLSLEVMNFDYLMLPVNPFVKNLTLVDLPNKPIIAMNPFANFFWTYQHWNIIERFYNHKFRRRFNPIPNKYLNSQKEVKMPPNIEDLISFALKTKNINGICFGSTNLNHITEISECFNKY